MNENSREKILADVRGAADAATNGSIAQIQALRLLAELQGHRTPPAPPRERTVIHKTEIRQVEELLRDTQADRKAAEKKGSWVAAARLMSLEAELLTRFEQLRACERKESQANRNEEQLLADFRADFAALPVQVQQRIRDFVVGHFRG